MQNKKEQRKEPLETNILAALHNIDAQVARAMQRSPDEIERFGLQKQSLYLEKVEKVVQFILDSVGRNETRLDSILVLSQALIKTLRIIIEELGESDLGKTRSQDCLLTLDNLERDIRQASFELRPITEQ